jgi:hypothetical protein
MSDIEINEKRLKDAVEVFCFQIGHIAIFALGQKPLWEILEFVSGASRLAAMILPDSAAAERQAIEKLMIERLLMVAAENAGEKSVVEGLFDSACAFGFTNEANAIVALRIYCNWLKSHGRPDLLDAVIARTQSHVAHPYFQSQLELIAAGKDPFTTEQSELPD